MKGLKRSLKNTDQPNQKENTMTKELEILTEALVDADSAALEVTCSPMHVTDGVNNYTVNDGVCGFAWVNIRPARGKFVKLLKDRKIGSTDSYYGGYTVWSKANTQSLTRNQEWARAFARVLNSNGIKATAASRID